jgi:hypothetical protein
MKRKSDGRQVVRARIASERIHTISLGACEVLDVLRAVGHKVPATAKVTFSVPGGGDWSGSDVELASTEEANGDAVITIRWTDRVEEQG